MKKQLITRHQFKVMRWKNGGGVTAEIAIDPPGSDFKDGKFNWRLSSARIEGENQFSSFPGYDRLLTVLSGEGLLLNHQELGPFEVFEFQGEDLIDCVPVNEAVEDLGLIFKRGVYKGSLRILEVTAPMYLKLNPGVHFFLSLSKPVNAGGTELRPTDFLRLEEASSIEISARSFPAHILQIEISPTGVSGTT